MNHRDVLLQRVVEYLDSQNWTYKFEGRDNNVISFGMNIKSKLKSCRMYVFVGEEEIQSIAVSPINATEDVYDNVVEFITRANYGLKVGNFEFDYSDGEVRYQTCLVCSKGVPEMDDVERVVDLPMHMMQRYGDGLAKNMVGYGNPEADIREIEG